jgi:hypothetical protein
VGKVDKKVAVAAATSSSFGNGNFTSSARFNDNCVLQIIPLARSMFGNMARTGARNADASVWTCVSLLLVMFQYWLEQNGRALTFVHFCVRLQEARQYHRANSALCSIRGTIT